MNATATALVGDAPSARPTDPREPPAALAALRPVSRTGVIVELALDRPGEMVAQS